MHKNNIHPQPSDNQDKFLTDFGSFSVCKEMRTGTIEKDVLIKNIENKLEENLTDMLSANELAGIMYLSQRTFSRRLQKAGVNYRKLLSSVRCKAAKEFLFNPALSISEIGQILGYSDSANFTKAFKSWTGQTPRAYRKGCSEPDRLNS